MRRFPLRPCEQSLIIFSLQPYLTYFKYFTHCLHKTRRAVVGFLIIMIIIQRISNVFRQRFELRNDIDMFVINALTLYRRFIYELDMAEVCGQYGIASYSCDYRDN